MKKGEFVTAIAEISGFTKKDTEVFLESFIEAVGDALAIGEDVKLVGFGTFSAKEMGARERRNPKTGEKVFCPKYKTIKFKAGKDLKEKV